MIPLHFNILLQKNVTQFSQNSLIHQKRENDVLLFVTIWIWMFHVAKYATGRTTNFSACTSHTWKSGKTLTKVKYTLSILQIYWKYTSKKHLKYNSSILEACFKYASSYLKYTSSLLQRVQFQKKKYFSSLYYLDKRSKFEAHFVKLNHCF